MKKHSLHFVAASLAVALITIGMATAIKIFAESATSTIGACTYSYTDWTPCDISGYRYREVKSMSPEGCDKSLSPPLTKEYCETVQNSCIYEYGEWGTCVSGYQTRPVLSAIPSTCDKNNAPDKKRTCVSSATTASNESSCSYAYSSWEPCDSSGHQKRKVLSKTPTDCSESASPPYTSRACAYSEKTTGASGGEGQTSIPQDVTPAFSFSNITDGTVISGIFRIRGNVAGANSVEYFMIPASSNIPKYLGSAKTSSSNIWDYSFNSENHPNGNFSLRARIKNAYGSYESPMKRVTILNRTGESEAPSAGNIDSGNPRDFEYNVNNKNDEKALKWQDRFFGSKECLDVNICGSMADIDLDELNNNDEFRFGTNPKDPDTDHDGFLDGDEIKNGYNPLKASAGDKGDKMVFESPKEKGDVKKDIYKVENVEMIQAENGEKRLKFIGKALPNAFVTLYIYSEPIVLTVKTDTEGNWSYVLDKEMGDGNHEVYVAVTDNTGKITGKSESLPFVKTAQAISILPPAEAASAAQAMSPTEGRLRSDFYYYVAITLGGFALALAAIGLLIHNAHKKSEEF